MSNDFEYCFYLFRDKSKEVLVKQIVLSKLWVKNTKRSINYDE